MIIDPRVFVKIYRIDYFVIAIANNFLITMFLY